MNVWTEAPAVLEPEQKSLPPAQPGVNDRRRSQRIGARVVELFGPAAVGKSTLARALAAEFAQRNVPVRLVASARPAEQGRGSNGSRSGERRFLPAPVARAIKVFGALGVLMPGAPVDALVADLMAILPPGKWIRSIRMRRYSAALCRSWRSSESENGVVLFDQGFVTLLSSLALLSGPIDERSLARGLALIPKPDLLIRVDASRAVVAARLEKRLRRQSPLERMFENRIAVSLRQVDLSVTLDSLLEKHGQPVMRVSWRDRSEIQGIAAMIADRMTWQREGRPA